MEEKRSLGFNYLSVFAVLLVVFAMGQLAQSTCRTDGGVTCCGRVYVDSGYCCWTVACSDGYSDGGCSTCLQARLRNTIQKNGVQKDTQNKDITVLLTRLLAKDEEIARALKSLR